MTTTANATDWSPVRVCQKSSSFNSKFDNRAQVLSTHNICQPFRFAVVVKFNLQLVVKFDLQSVVKFSSQLVVKCICSFTFRLKSFTKHCSYCILVTTKGPRALLVLELGCAYIDGAFDADSQ